MSATAISLVPAPTSTRAMFSRRSSRGTTAFIAAIGSRVMLAMERPSMDMVV